MNLSPVLETERLRLFELSEHAPGDTAFVLELLNDPDFLRYIGDRGVHSLAQAADYLRDGPVASYRLNGFGLYRVERREDGAAVGMCGLIKRPPLAHPDLGYALLPRFRGNGYVAEAARAVLAAAREQDIATVLAVVDPDNAASIRTLRDLDFGYREMIRLAADDIELKLFAWQSDKQ
ncbi:GNAT family N-acetyltransferase [Pseudoxanthomonas sp. z9]|uniref:GNAT family N-acetyltransferase n=1 Tax=Pseudoxanthomonas sp. z9 TaxID=2584942 RepID=UPI0011448962|nr:GNAT family N-acetyltransferase [Pseudoxanthomonas sp. z9]MCL6711540.1 GNAT family N-acetyltransferase [Pseudomonas sp. R2.Fl]